MAGSMAELEIVPRPEVTAAISDDPHDLCDVSSEDEEAEEEFTAIELVRAVPVPDLVPVPAVQVPVFRLPVYWYRPIGISLWVALEARMHPDPLLGSEN